MVDKKLDDILIYILDKYNDLSEIEKKEQLSQYRDLIHDLISIHYNHKSDHNLSMGLYTYTGNFSDKFLQSNKIYCIQDLNTKITRYIDVKVVQSDKGNRYIIPGHLEYNFVEYENTMIEAAIHNVHNDNLV